MAKPQNRVLQPRSLKQDDLVMATNNSSIVSKRSVERLYYSNEPQFFRYFVKKPQRRAPLINRGYWLRMKAVEFVVRRFLEEPSNKPKIVVNLGCGYDPNPWQCFFRYPKECKDVKFIDVDYMPLMLKKRDVVMKTDELLQPLTNLFLPEAGPVLLCSDQYLQVGCDLCDLSKLAESLASVVDLKECIVLCTAEVSITYMNVEAANALIEWTFKLPHAQFCLLEQLLPDGSDYPFAKTMLAHFEKLQTPLRAASQYPTTAAQEVRFKAAGWTNVCARSLWDLWDSDEFLTSVERATLDDIEPFDEWEEFALFGCHYFLLHASNSSECKIPRGNLFGRPSEIPPSGLNPIWITSAKTQRSRGCRRFAAALPVRGSNRQQYLAGNFGGMGPNSRLNSYDVYSPSSNPPYSFPNSGSSIFPSARMCHTITDLGEAGVLLVGGRNSPDSALADCWLYHKWTNTWERVDDLPTPRYRHSTILIKDGTVLVAGGKSDSRNIVIDFCIWSRHRGWIRCALLEKDHPVLFGAILMTSSQVSTSSALTLGILAGGISLGRTISRDIWFWTLEGCDTACPSIRFAKRADASLARFGATLIRHGGQLLILGGVAQDHMLTFGQDVKILNVSYNGDETGIIALRELQFKAASPRPFLIGSSAFSSADGLIVMGGGAVCFSFGTYWSREAFSLSYEGDRENGYERFVDADSYLSDKNALESWTYSQTIELPLPKDLRDSRAEFYPEPTHKLEMIQVPPIRIASSSGFCATVASAKLAVLKELDLGSCTQKWSTEYLIDRIGRDRNVVVHQASTVHMDFLSKNFQYVTKPFGAFMESIEAGEKLYLRSLSAEKPSDSPANLKRDFPSIANDFQLPRELEFVEKNAHSSPLRISGPVDMWLHYDVMANVLCQIRGTKRLLIFPPSDVRYFDFPPGASSSNVDVFRSLNDPRFAYTHPHEVTLCPGDVMFLPPLWLHAASPTEGVSIAVNVFFRNLESGYAAGKDVYGNRDFHAYEKGRQDIARIGNSFNSLPVDVREFYLFRLAEELRERSALRRN